MAFPSDLTQVFDYLANQALANALDENLPIVGPALADQIEALGLDAFRDEIIQAQQTAAGLADPALRAQAFADAITNTVPGVTAALNGTTVDLHITRVLSTGATIATGPQTLGGTGASLSADVTLNGSIDATLDVTLQYEAVGATPANDTVAYVNANGAAPEVSVQANLDAAYEGNLTLGPNLLGITVEESHEGPELSAQFGINMPDLVPGNLEIQISGGLELDPLVTLDLPTPVLPDFYAQFELDWNLATPAMLPQIAITDIGVDLASLVDQMDVVLQPITEFLFDGAVGSILDAISEPIPGINDFFDLLNLPDPVPGGASFINDTPGSPLDLLNAGDGTFNFLDLIGAYFLANDNGDAYKKVSVFAEVLAFLKTLDDLQDGDAQISLGSLSFDASGNIDTFTEALDGGLTPLDQLSGLILDNEVFQRVMDEVEGLLADQTDGGVSNITLDDDEGFSFPLFEDPSRIVDVLFQLAGGGPPVPLIQYDLPAQLFGGQFSAAIPIIGPLMIELEGGAQIGFDFAIGYDTLALTTLDPLDGIYLTTRQLEDGEWGIGPAGGDAERIFEYAPLASASSFIEGSLKVDAIIASAEAGGRISGFLGAFLPGGEVEPGYDPGNANGFLRWSDVAGGCIFDPLLGAMYAEIFAELSVGIGPFSKTERITIVSTTIADLSYGCTPTNIIDGLGHLVGGTTAALHVGPDRPMRIINGVADTDEREQYFIGDARDENGSLIPGAVTLYYKQFQQVLGDGPGEGPVDTITADFGAFDDWLKAQDTLTQSIVVSGGAGNDVLAGAAGDDTLSGGNDDDELNGKDGDDVLNGDGGNDFLDGGAGADSIDGGTGTDEVRYTGSPSGVDFNVVITGGTNVSFHGISGDALGDVLSNIEVLTGSDHNDRLFANPFQSSTLSGRDGNDTLVGGAGDDFVIGGAGADLLLGGAGTDGTSYFDSRAGVQVDLASGTASGGAAQGDILSSIEALQGSYFADVLLGTNGGESISGLEGDDLIDGRGGSDLILAEGGNDTVMAYAISGSAHGGTGRDLLDFTQAGGRVDASLDRGSAFRIGFFTQQAIAPQDVPAGSPPPPSPDSSFEDLKGSAFDDVLEGDRIGNRIAGWVGNDTLRGLDGWDTLQGGFGNDDLNGGPGRDTADYSDGFQVTVSLDSGTGTGSTAQGDTLTSIENLIGTSGGDDLEGDAGENWIDPGLARGSDDTVAGLAGADRLLLDWSQGDTGLGMTGSAALGAFQRLAADGITTLDRVGFTGISTFEIRGTLQGDTVTTSAGNDRLFMGGGGDVIDAGTGADVVVAGSEGDLVRWRLDVPGGGPMFLDGGSGIDILEIDLSAATQNLTVVAGAAAPDGVNLRLANGGVAQNFEVLGNVATGLGKDRLEQPGLADNIFDGGEDADILLPGLGIDQVSGGADFGVEVDLLTTSLPPLYDLAASAVFQDLLDARGDTMVLDYATAGSAVRSEAGRSLSGTVQVSQGSYSALYLSGTEGTFRTTDGANALDFDNIERIQAIGSDFADVLYGTWRGAVLGTFAGGPGEMAEAQRGDDDLTGGADNDTLVGLTGSDSLTGGDGADVLVGSDPSLSGGVLSGSPTEPVDPYEIDLMIGGAEADLFVLGVAVNAAESFYLGRLPGQTDAQDARAIITDFDATEGDVLQLAGSAADYTLETGGGVTRILRAGSTRDIVAELQTPTGFALNTSAVQYATPGTPLWQPGQIPGLFDAAAPLAMASIAPPLSYEAAPAPSWITQTADRTDLITAFFGGGGDLSQGSLTLSGDARGFGVFRNDPFGLGTGIVLSSGQVEQVAGPNEEDGGPFGPQVAGLDFVEIGTDVGANVRFYRAEVSNLIGGLRSFTLSDAGLGLTTGSVSGADIDAVVLSRTRLESSDSQATLNALTTLDVFDYSAAGIEFNPGTVGGVASPTLSGSTNGIVNNAVATLGSFDYQQGGVNSSLSLGDGGSITFELTEAVDTNGPLYIYVAEAGSPEAVLPGLSGSSGRVEPLSDLSTDFGAPGAVDDTVVFDYEFTTKVLPGTASTLMFDFTLVTEELTEFAGSEFNDTWSVKLNGVELARLSDGAATTAASLMPALYGVQHPDLILNPDNKGLGTPGPLADQIRADAYTKTQTFAGALIDGENRLTIQVADLRDGFLDSGIFLSQASVVSTPAAATSTLPALLPGSAPAPLPEGLATQVTFTLTGLAGATAPVTVTLTPDADLDLGAGPGVAVDRRLEAGDDPVIRLQAIAVFDGLAEPGEFGVINATLSSLDPAFDGAPAAPLLIEIVDIAAPTGTSGNDLIVGSDGGEVLDGLGGDDSIEARAGNDTLIGGAGADMLDGEAGFDLASYAGSATGVAVRLWTGAGLGGDAAGDVLSDIEGLVGSDYADTLVGDFGQNNHLDGRGGDDLLKGLSGNDTLIGGAGADDLQGDQGFDLACYMGSATGVAVRLWTGAGLGGEAAGDVLSDIEGLVGSAFADTLVGDFGQNNHLDGRGGDDLLKGLSGNDTLIGGAGADDLQGDQGFDLASYVRSSAGVAVRLWTGTGLGGDAAGDVLSDIEGLVGSAFADTLVGNFGQNNHLDGRGGDDLVKGLSGNDTIIGGVGADSLEGDQGNDVLRGGDGADRMTGGDGLDIYTGGQGADRFVFQTTIDAGIGALRDQILDFEKGVDLIDLSGLAAGTLQFRGTSPFAPSGNPELRLFETPTGSTIVQLDVNGDGTADAEIRVANVTGLTAEDFGL